MTIFNIFIYFSDEEACANEEDDEDDGGDDDEADLIDEIGSEMDRNELQNMEAGNFIFNLCQFQSYCTEFIIICCILLLLYI